MRAPPLLACLAGALLLLAFAPSAGARTVTLSGTVRGDSDATVAMKIVIRGGLPRLVSRFTVRQLDHECTDQRPREYNRTFPRRIAISRLGITSKYVFSALVTPRSTPPLAPGSYFVSGDLRRSARRVTDGQISSTIRFPSSQPSGETACVSDGLVRFIASR